MNRENWLKPISKEDVAKFAYQNMNLEQIMMLNESEEENYGKFFQVGGFTNEHVGGWGSANKYLNPIALGEYGPLDVDPYAETTVDDIKQLFSGNENLISIYLAWVAFVSSKNKGRMIDGKTYEECFSNACNDYIDLLRKSQIGEIERKANEKRSCVKSFVGQLNSVKTSEEVEQAQE